MRAWRPVPPVGCWVQDPDGRQGIVRALEEADEPCIVVEHAAGCRTRFAARLARSAFTPGMQAQLVPRLPHQPARTANVLATRCLAGHDQVLVQWQETGRSAWLPFYRLRRVKPIEDRLLAGDAGVEPDHAERFRLRVLAHAISSWDQQTGSLARLDVDPLPHQAGLVHRILSSGTLDWLIADDVGLGKTIEVGLLLHALERQGRARRVLIVCPAGLVRQWQDELTVKFACTYEIWGHDFAVHDPAILRARDRVIVSLDRAKRPEEKERLLAAGGWDVVVFDEAHRLGHDGGQRSTERFALAQDLRPLTSALLLLSGTPHQGKTARFVALLGLLRPDRAAELSRLELHPEIVAEMVLRNRKAKVTDAAGELLFKGHETRRIAVASSPLAAAFRDALQAYLRYGYKAAEAAGQGRGATRGAGLVMTAFRKLAASSPAAIVRALERRAAVLDGIATADQPDEEAEPDDASAVDERRVGPGQAFFTQERELVAALIHAGRKLAGQDTKLARFLTEIVAPVRRGGRRLLVFTEYRATQEYLQVALRQAFPDDPEPALIHGGMSLDDKLAAITAFTAEVPVLISTEAGGEGLNLHERCHVLVNYDLPWNPSRIVQRIGRLYRYGQRHKVLVFNLHLADVFDESLVITMLERIESVARDMAAVSADYGPGLELEILGQMLETVDLEAILERASEGGAARTREEIEAAVEEARRAVEMGAQFLDLAEGFETGPVTGAVTPGHVHAFVEAMLPRLGLGRAVRCHDGRALSLRVDSALRRRFPELGPKAHEDTMVMLSADRELRRRLSRGAVLPLDFDSALFRHLIAAAKERAFDGMYATLCHDHDGLLTIWLARYQDELGRPAGDELVPVACRSGESVILRPEELATALFRPAETAESAESGERRAEQLAAARGAAERGLRAMLTGTLRQPNDLQLLAAAERVAVD